MGDKIARHGYESQGMTPEERRQQNRLWFGIFAAPLSFLVNMQLSYSMVDWACLNGARAVLSIVPIPFLAIALLGFFAARAQHQRLLGNGEAGEAIAIHERSLFMARTGLGSSALFFLLIFAQWIATFFFSPCKT